MVKSLQTSPDKFAMPDANRRTNIALLALPEVTASTLLGMYDLFASTGRDWQWLTQGEPGEPKMNPVIVSRDGRPFAGANRRWVHPDASIRDCPAPDVICVPDIMVMPDEDIAGRYDLEVEWVRDHYLRGATLASACSGALFLAEAGLLDGQDATIHWAYCDAMAARYPTVRLYPNRALVISGESQRLVMAGGGSSWHDLTLYLIARLLGVEEAMQVAKLNLLDWHHVGQQPFAALTRTRQREDATIAKCQEWVALNYDQDAPVAAMANLSGLPERSFKRRFLQATGMSPMEYVHTVRLEEAKHVLETSDMPIEAVANEVGYEDASFFGRLFRRKVGLTPALYRKKFLTLRRAMSEQGTTPARRAGSAPPTHEPHRPKIN